MVRLRKAQLFLGSSLSPKPVRSLFRRYLKGQDVADILNDAQRLVSSFEQAKGLRKLYGSICLHSLRKLFSLIDEDSLDETVSLLLVKSKIHADFGDLGVQIFETLRRSSCDLDYLSAHFPGVEKQRLSELLDSMVEKGYLRLVPPDPN